MGFKHICTLSISPIQRGCLHALPLALGGLSTCLEKWNILEVPLLCDVKARCSCTLAIRALFSLSVSLGTLAIRTQLSRWEGVGPGHKVRPPRGSGQHQSWVPADSQWRLQGDSSSPLIHYSAWEKASESLPPELRQPAGARKATGTCAWGCFSTIYLCCLLPSACVCSIWGLDSWCRRLTVTNITVI